MSGTGRPTYTPRIGSDDPAKPYLRSSHQMVRSMPGHQNIQFRQKEIKSKEEMLNKLKKYSEQTIELKDAEKYKDDDSDSYYETDSSESNSDDEQSNLMKEFQRIKQERLKQKMMDEERESQNRLDQIISEQSVYSTKLNWMEETPFMNQSVVEEETNIQYYNDPTNSHYNKRFIQKYVNS